MEWIDVSVPIGGQTFAFKLCHRQIEIEAAGMIDYYWMAVPKLRSGGQNAQRCIDSWWAETEAQGFTDEEDRADAGVNLAFAELYPLICADKSLQDVFRDAFLHKCADREFVVSPDDEARVSALVANRDREGIRCEMQNLLMGELPPDHEKPLYRLACQHWIGNAVVALRNGDRGQLRTFLEGDLACWLKKYRRRGDEYGQSKRVRLFLNMLGYEAKVAFFLCYANAWAKITPWLVNHRKLDVVSARFLALWHNQNQPDDGRDVFWGHVLALHPLSERVMNEPHHLVALGRWISLARQYGAELSPAEAASDEYWAAVEAILLAAHEYKGAWVHDQERRGVTLVAKEAIGLDPGTPADEPDPFRDFLEDEAERQSLSCPLCQGRLAYCACRKKPPGGPSDLETDWTCRSCGKEALVRIAQNQTMTLIPPAPGA